MLSAEFICRMVGHKRSKRAAVRHGYGWHSECIFCHTPMLRLGLKNWKVLADQPEQHQD